MLEVLLNNVPDGKGKEELFNEYKGVRFPFVDGQKTKTDVLVQDVLQRAFDKGAYEIDRGSAPSKKIRSTI